MVSILSRSRERARKKRGGGALAMGGYDLYGGYEVRWVGDADLLSGRPQSAGNGEDLDPLSHPMYTLRECLHNNFSPCSTFQFGLTKHPADITHREFLALPRPQNLRPRTARLPRCSLQHNGREFSHGNEH